MRVLIDHNEPFLLAHGGLQVQIEKTAGALASRGVDLDFLHWWDACIAPDVIHFFGVPTFHYAERARSKGIKLVVTHLLTNTCNRSPRSIAIQSLVTRVMMGVSAMDGICRRFGWRSLQLADAVIVGLSIEKAVMRRVWNIEASKLHVVPLGLSEPFFSEREKTPFDPPPLPFEPQSFLVSVGTICARKRQVQLARMAIASGIPVVFVGGPLSETDPEWIELNRLSKDGGIAVLGHISSPEMLEQVYRAGRGFVHYSDGENWCLAAHEAAACGLPLLLPDQPWARERFGNAPMFFGKNSLSDDLGILREFHRSAPTLHSPTIRHFSWSEIADQLIGIYKASGNGKRKAGPPQNPLRTSL